MSKVVFLALNYSSVETAPGMYHDLMGSFHSHGHDVYVVAPTLEGMNETQMTVEAGVNVLRVPTLNLFGNGIIQKGISNILLPIQYKRAIRNSFDQIDFDIIIIPTPPITMISVALWLKKKTKGKLYLILRDIFPQNGVDLKILSKNSLVYKYFRRLEKILYKKSDAIGCMSPGNKKYILRHNPYLDSDKLHMLPNWEKLIESNESKEAKLRLREKYGLVDKVVGLYAGNIGIPQQLENIVHLAEQSTDLERMVFLIIGWGTQKEKIENLAKEKGLDNIIFLESVNRLELGKILSISDIGLISLNKDFTIPNYPSKVNSYYRYKIPVLASLDANTDFGAIQEEIGCGFWSLSGDTLNLKENLIKLYESEELRLEMGLRGYRHMKENLTPDHSYKIIVDQLNKLLA